MLRALWVVCRTLRRDARGAAGIEYALLAAMLTVSAAGVAVELKHSFTGMVGNINASLSKD
jgi:Flp pilus assembly pilin Flp